MVAKKSISWLKACYLLVNELIEPGTYDPTHQDTKDIINIFFALLCIHLILVPSLHEFHFQFFRQ